MIYNSSNDFNFDDCVSRGACSVSPNVSSMQEVMFLLLRQIAYYLIKLKGFGVIKEDIMLSLVTQIAMMDAAKDFTEVQILDSFSREYTNLVHVRKEYLRLCKEHNISCLDLKNLLKFSPSTSLSNILKKGEKESSLRYKKLDGDKKYLAEILLAVIKSVCLNLSLLCGAEENFEGEANGVLTALNLFNYTRILPEKIKDNIIALSNMDIEILKRIGGYRLKNFGSIQITEVPHSTRSGKAIMVAGKSLADLAAILEFVKDKEIDVYTNGNLLIAHTYPYFKSFKNLRGHFGGSTSMLDFATFPGAILLTKNETQNIQYLYRGRLFTTDDIQPKGVAKIENNDFTPLVKSAIEAKGFHKGQKRPPEIVGFNEEILDKKFDEIVSKNYDKIFIISYSSISSSQKDYFENFFTNMPENTFAITFSNTKERERVLPVNIGNDYSLLYSVLHKVFKKIPVTSDKLAFFLAKCDTNSLSFIISLKNHGAKNIFLSECPPLVINPAVLREFSNLFKINIMTNPKEDISKI